MQLVGGIPLYLHNRPKPVIDWSFMKALPSVMNFSRAGNATYVDENGYVTWAPANMLPNGDFTGAVKPSRFPDGWVAVAAQDGIAVTVEDTGYEDGTPYVDIRYAGTANNTSGSLHVFAANYSFPASLGQSYTMSLHARHVGGSLAGVASVNIASREYANNTGLGASFGNTVLALTTTKTRFHRTYVCVEPTITQIKWGSRVVANLGETIDVTIRYYQGMMERTSYNSPRPYIPTSGSAYYGPRFDYDPVTHEPLGLLMEEQRTNLVFPSVIDQSGTGWSVQDVGFGGAITSPDGTSSMRRIVDNPGSSWHGVKGNIISFTSGTAYTESFYVKAGTEQVVQITFNSSVFTTNPHANFNLATGQLGTVSGCTASMKHVGGGVYRCAVTATPSASGMGNSILAAFTNNNETAARIPAYVGSGNYFYLWGCQNETASFATSYIPTSGAGATRAMDMLYTTALSWFNATQGTLLTEYDVRGASSQVGFSANFNANSTSQYIGTYYSTALEPYGQMYTSGGYGSLPGAALTPNIPVKQAISYILGGHKAASGGAILGDGNLVVAPIPSGIARLNLGNRYDGARPLSGHLRVFKYWNRAFSDAELQRITT